LVLSVLRAAASEGKATNSDKSPGVRSRTTRNRAIAQYRHPFPNYIATIRKLTNFREFIGTITGKLTGMVNKCFK
jgi:hypothetical protein